MKRGSTSSRTGARLRRLARGAIAVAALALVAAAAAPAPASAQAPYPTAAPGVSALDGHGMWIWYVSRAGGSAKAIADRAIANGIDHVLIKSSDAGSRWSQFTPQLVNELRARGLRVCAWQFVYGRNPGIEADAGAWAVSRGAQCLVIDAEGHYEGRYRAADAYIRRLRAKVGPSYPLVLASFPYVHFHPGFPYSVFLGRRGAQLNAPQMYWRAIGTSVARVFRVTYRFNRVYRRPIYPLGQTYNNPPAAQLTSFRRFASSYGARGISWWSWQHTTAGGWQTLRRANPGPWPRFRPRPGLPVIKPGRRGDIVLQAQQLLRAWGHRRTPLTGIHGKRSRRVVRAFQRRRGIRPHGHIRGRTWVILLRRAPIHVRWARSKSRRFAHGAAARGREPLSARMPARRYEIPRATGSG